MSQVMEQNTNWWFDQSKSEPRVWDNSPDFVPGWEGNFRPLRLITRMAFAIPELTSDLLCVSCY